MKKTRIVLYGVCALIVGMTGCSSDTVQSAIDTYKNSGSSTKDLTAATVKYIDGSTMVLP